jgi:hypothetical protein
MFSNFINIFEHKISEEILEREISDDKETFDKWYSKVSDRMLSSRGRCAQWIPEYCDDFLIALRESLEN